MNKLIILSISYISLLYGSAIIFITAVFGYLSGCAISDSIFGPTDADIESAETYANQLNDDDPEKPSAIERVNTLKQKRKTADDNAQTASDAINYIIPGAGALIGLAYGVSQRLRNRKNVSALTATIEAIETFKTQGGIDITNQLVEFLSKNHDATGTKDEIRKIRREIKSK